MGRTINKLMKRVLRYIGAYLLKSNYFVAVLVFVKCIKGDLPIRYGSLKGYTSYEVYYIYKAACTLCSIYYRNPKLNAPGSWTLERCQEIGRSNYPVPILILLSEALIASGLRENAEVLLTTAYSSPQVKEGNTAEILHAIMKLKIQLWKGEEAIILYRQSHVNSVRAKDLASKAYLDLGKIEVADRMAGEILQKNPYNTSAVKTLMRTEIGLGNSSCAATYRTMILSKSIDEDSYISAAKIFYLLGEYFRALYYAHRAMIRAKSLSKQIEAATLLGSIHQSRGEYTASLWWFTFSENKIHKWLVRTTRTLKARGALFTTRRRMGEVLMRMGDFNEAQSSPYEYMAKDVIKYTTALYMGEFSKAWATNSDRDEARELKRYFGSRYIGGNADKGVFEGASVLVIGQGGIGDQVRLFGILSDILAMNPRELTVSCDPRLCSILGRSFPGVRALGVKEYRATNHVIVTDRKGLRSKKLARILNDECCVWGKQCDIVVELYDLQQIFRGNEQAFKQHIPYIKPSSEHIQYWQRRIAQNSGDLKVGLCWRSGIITPSRVDHYTLLEDWLPILSDTRLAIVNLQNDISKHEISILEGHKSAVIYGDLDEKNDVESLAAISKALDVIVAPQTFISQLASASGARVMLFMPSMNGSWRCGNDGSDIWFNNAMVVFPMVPGNKAELVSGIHNKLNAMISNFIESNEVEYVGNCKEI